MSQPDHREQWRKALRLEVAIREWPWLFTKDTDWRAISKHLARGIRAADLIIHEILRSED